jgi:uncharacterized protein (DUF608 family)
MDVSARAYNGVYAGEYLSRVAFPLGGMGAGMLCLEGAGALSHVSLRGRPDVFNEPPVFSALCVKGTPNVARVLEGPVPGWKVFGPAGTGNGGVGRTYGLPRLARATFRARFPFATVNLEDPRIPLQVELTGWSPFTPGDADSPSLPVAALEYRFVNPGDRPVEAIYSFHARNFMATGRPWELEPEGPGGEAVCATRNGFVLSQARRDGRPWDQGAFSAVVDDAGVKVNCAWFRGGWYDPLTILWKTISQGEAPEAGPIMHAGARGEPSPGGSLYVPFRLGPGEEKLVRLRLAWYVPETGLRVGDDRCEGLCAEGSPDCGDGSDLPRHRPWYAGVFEDIEAVTEYWRETCDVLRERSAAFRDCFYDTTLPPEVVEAVAANLTILKSPTVLRQTDGRLWCWEGCCDSAGCCAGSCTHVWNYAQALPHLFPDMERSLRQTEFNENQDERGHQAFRASLPIRPTAHGFHAAADGQLGGIMKVYREWRISGDSDWLRDLWPQVKQSLNYCIGTWDPDHRGVLAEPHHNTYDVEFWGPDGMCTSFYLGALKAAMTMAEGLEHSAVRSEARRSAGVPSVAVGDSVPLYAELFERGRAWMESELWNGEYFVQKIEWQDLRAGDPTQEKTLRTTYSPEALELLRREGPKYQYGDGCLSDGVLGAWMAAVCGVGEILDREKVAAHLLAVFRHNFKRDLSGHANPQRPTFALGKEGGLLLCTWPRGGDLSLPFVYSDEVWTGIEYQVASHLMMMGYVDEGLEIVRTVRDRYDGRVRNPFNEYECGHWYARAMSSYALLQGLTGVHYDAVDRTLTIKPSIRGDFRSFFCTATGYGTVEVRGDQPIVAVKEGVIPYERIVYEPCEGPHGLAETGG